MKKYTSGQDIPLGLGIALEKNNAMDTFFSLPPAEQQRIIEHTHAIQSKSEMRAYVQSIMETKNKPERSAGQGKGF